MPDFHAAHYAGVTYELKQQLIGTGIATSIHADKILVPDKDGIYQAYPTDEPAWQYARTVLDGAAGTDVDVAYADDGVGGILDPQPYLHYQPAAVNFILYSRSFNATSYWLRLGSPTLTQDQIGIDGVSNKAWTIEDTNTSDHGSIHQSTSRPAGVHSCVFFVKKDADVSRFLLLGFIASPVLSQIFFNTSTGAYAERSGHTDGEIDVLLIGSYWRIIIQITSNSNPTLTCQLYPAIGTTWEVIDVNATGSAIFDNVMILSGISLNEAKRIGPIITSAASVTTGAVANTWNSANHVNTEGSYYLEIEYYGAHDNLLLVDGVPIIYIDYLIDIDLVTNGDFPTDTTGWIASNAILSHTTFDSRPNVLAVADSGEYSSAKQTLTTVIGETYTISCIAHNNNINNNDWIGVNDGASWADGVAGDILSTDISDPGAANSSWHIRTYEFVALSTTTMIGVGSGGANTAYFDDITVGIRAPRVVLDDGITTSSVAITEGKHQIGFAYSDTDLKMRLNLDRTWETEVAYDGSFGVGDIVSKSSIRNLQRKTEDYATAQTTIVSLMSINIIPLSGDYTYTAPDARIRLGDLYSAVIFDLNPVAYWRLNETIGASNAIDTVGAVNALFVNSPILESVGLLSSIGNTAVAFNGTNQYATATITNFRENDTVGAITAWIKLNAIGAEGAFFSSADITSGTVILLGNIQNDGKIAFEIRGTANIYNRIQTVDPVILDTEVHFICITSNGNTIKIFIDGIELTTTIAVGTNVGQWFAYADTARDNVVIGALLSNSLSAFFPGILDEIAVFNTALSDIEIHELYLSGLVAEDILVDSGEYSYIGTDTPIIKSILPFVPNAGNYSYIGTATQIHKLIPIIPEAGDISYIGTDTDIILVSGQVITPESGYYAYSLSPVWVAKTIKNTHELAAIHLWHEGNYPPFEHVLGTLLGDRKPVHWGPIDLTSLSLASTALLANIIRNDAVHLENWQNDAVTAEAPLLYFYGCDVTPKSIHVDEVLTGDYFVPIQIANSHLNKSIEIRNIWIENDPFNTMEILGANWPKWLAPYSVETYTLKISGTEGYPNFDALVIVDAGTCYTEIPVTGVRDVACPICPDCPPPCPPEETEDMPSCMIEQELCAISRGDTVPFSFVFVTPSGAAMDISNMQLEFTLKIDVKQETPDLIKTITFPATADSIAGIGTMKITPTETLSLLAGACYCFKFKLRNGVDDVYTIGLGTVRVNPDPPTPIT